MTILPLMLPPVSSPVTLHCACVCVWVWVWCVCALSRFCCVWLFAAQWTVARQAPLSMGFSRQEHWSAFHVLLQGVFPTRGSNLILISCTGRQVLYHEHQWLSLVVCLLRTKPGIFVDQYQDSKIIILLVFNYNFPQGMFMVLLSKSILVTWKFHKTFSTHKCFMMSLDGQFLFMPECSLFVANILQAWWETKRNFGKCLLEVWNLLKYCTMKHCLQLWLNYILICFCIYWSCKQLPKFRLPHREELWFLLCEGMHPLFCFCFCSIFSSPAFYSLFLMKVTSPFLPCPRIYSTHWYFRSQIKKNATSCPFSTYSLLFSFGAVIRETTP